MNTSTHDCVHALSILPKSAKLAHEIEALRAQGDTILVNEGDYWLWIFRAGEACGHIKRLEAEVTRLTALINSPETDDWLQGVVLEAAHQVERWGSNHDAGKMPLDWFWLIGYLAQKAATSAIAADLYKAKHHTISTAAALLNWHRHLTGEETSMRPGIAPEERGIKEPADG